MIRKKILLFLLLVNTIFACAQVNSKWMFHGITIEEDLGCANKVSTRHEIVWLPFSESYKQERAAMNQRLKEAYQPNYFMVKTIDITPGKLVFIALVERSRKCSGNKASKPLVPSFAFYSGPSAENIVQQIEKDMSLYSFVLVSYKIVQMLNSDDELSKLMTKEGKKAAKEPEVEKPLNVAAPQNSVVSNQDGLIVKTTAITKKNGDMIVQVKLTNSRQLMSAIVEITPAGKPTEKHFVDPSEALTLYYDRSVSVRTSFVEKSKKSRNFTDKIIKWIQYDIILDATGVKQQKDGVAIGVRG